MGPNRLGPVRSRVLGTDRRRSSCTWSPSWTRRRRSRPGRWPSVGSGRRSSAGACSAARSTTRSSAGGPGAAAGSASSATTSSSASATSTSPAPASSTPWAASPALAGAIILGPRIGKFGADGKPRSLAAHNIPMAMLGTFILLFGWFGFNAASTFAATDVRFTVVAANTAIAAAVRRDHRDVLRDEASREARSRHDGQRHARRSRGDHRAVRLRAAVGCRSDRRRSPR